MIALDLRTRAYRQTAHSEETDNGGVRRRTRRLRTTRHPARTLRVLTIMLANEY